MYYIYKITNIRNNKKYIGSTSNPSRRKKEHFKAAHLQSSLSYNYPLQKAIRKYGAENFRFEIIDKTPDRTRAVILEKQYIVNCDSLVNTGHGYNQTMYTDCALRDPKIIQEMISHRGKRCAEVNEKNEIIRIFDSVHEAARNAYGAQGNDRASTITKVCNGEQRNANGKIYRFVVDGEVVIPELKTRKRKKKIMGINKDDPKNIISFESKLEAEKIGGFNRSSIQKHLKGSSKYSHVGGYVWKEID